MKRLVCEIPIHNNFGKPGGRFSGCESASDFRIRTALDTHAVADRDKLPKERP